LVRFQPGEPIKSRSYVIFSMSFRHRECSFIVPPTH